MKKYDIRAFIQQHRGCCVSALFREDCAKPDLYGIIAYRDEEGNGMGLCVAELLQIEFLSEVKVLGGAGGLNNEIKGVTIIEAPDIVKFINGGEVLLTGLYAFRSCSVEEFKVYISELTKKGISALMLKKGRHVEFADVKISLLLEFAQTQEIPVLEVPFSTSFRDIVSLIMEKLFNEEVTRLKYFKTTHDNFAALSLSLNSSENGIERILDVLSKLIRNPVAAFNPDLSCMATTDSRINEIVLQETSRTHEPGLYTNCHYIRQKAMVGNGKKTEYEQSVVFINIMFKVKIYLVITEMKQELDIMDYIAIENAITSLQYEFSRQYAIVELEKKFQNDIMHNILNGKVGSLEELKKNTVLLNIPWDGSYRVLVFGVYDEGDDMQELNARSKYTNALSEAILINFEHIKMQHDLNQIIVIQEVMPEQKQEVYRQETTKIIEKIQKQIARQYGQLRVKAGIGRTVSGIAHISESYKEAGDAYLFADIVGETAEKDLPQIMLFSDLGIFKLLCQLDQTDMLLEYVPESLQRLYHYKKPQREDLMITLKTYLDRNQNLAKTAQDLFVHYKTAAYRIEKIVSITGIDFNNASEVLAVRIGMVVYKMIDNYKKRLKHPH